jgi:hypothetical protein
MSKTFSYLQKQICFPTFLLIDIFVIEILFDNEFWEEFFFVISFSFHAPAGPIFLLLSI